MRLNALHLEFFGHFTDKKFEFSSVPASGPDFHVIYGPNEAGKTTFMEAYLRLLYGFLPTEPYGFVHQRKNLRISGELDIDGTSKTLVRLPTKKGSLTDTSGTPVSESALQASLGGLSMQDYRNLLCIDDETIEKGGEEIVNSQGDIGSLLFSAAAGISDLSSVLGAVREEADLLFKKNSSNSQLAQLKVKLKDVDTRIAEQDVSAAQYKKLKAQLKAAELAFDEVKAESSELYSQQNLLNRQLEALPLLAQIDELDSELAPVAHYPEKLDIEHEQLLAMLPIEAGAMTEIKRRNEELELFKVELNGIEFGDKQLAIAESVEQLQPLYTGYTTARLGLESQRRKLAEAQQKMTLAARDFADDDVDPVQLLVSPSLIRELDQSVRDKQKAADDLADTRTALEEAKSGILEKKSSIAAMSPADDGGQLVSQIVEKFNARIFLPQFVEAEKKLGEAENEVSQALDSLALKGQVFTQAPGCRLHSKEVEELVKEHESLAADIEKALRDKSNVAMLIEHQQSEIAKIQAGGEVADDEQIAELKQQRDALWRAHRTDYAAATADAFEVALLQHDQSMDGRVSNAGTLGELRQLYQRVVDENNNEARIQDRITQLKQGKEAIENTLADAVREAGLSTSISPAVSKDWIQKCETAAAEERKRDRIKVELAQVLDKADALHSALSEHIVREQATLQELVDVARDIDSRYGEHQKKVSEEQLELSRMEADLNHQTELVEQRTQRFEQAGKAWRELVKNSFPVTVDADKLECTVNALHTLREVDKDRVSAAQQVQDMESAITQFSTEIEAVSRKMDVPVQESITDTYEAVKALSDEMLVAHRRQNQLLEDIKSTEQHLAQAETDLAANSAMRERLAAHFDQSIPTSSITELLGAEKIARETRQSRKKHIDAQKQLLQILGLGSMEEARSQLAELDASTLQISVRELEVEIKAVDAQYTAVIEQRTLCKSALDAIVGDATVAELHQKRTTLELEMADKVLQHLKLSLGHKLAQKAIMQYREKHRSSMMKTTESVFTELTNGAYKRLQSNTDGSVETLQVVQSNGTAKSVHEPTKSRRADASKAPRSDLSKGTRFQLYLALRAAAYEQLAAQGTCLPFICDDIFETFDEGRTRAACRVLERIGTTGQAIYLTHHQHVVDIAKEVSGENVSIHTL